MESFCCFACGGIAPFTLPLDHCSATLHCLLCGSADGAEAGRLGYGDGGYPYSTLEENTLGMQRERIAMGKEKEQNIGDLERKTN